MALIENINVSSPNDGLGDSLRDSQIKANNNFAELNDKKVEKIAGKDLSKNDFTDTLKTKLDSLEFGAGVQIQADWIQTDNLALDYIKNKPDLSQYFSAVGGFDYEDLATQTTPLNYTTGFLQLTNDILGANTKTNLNPYGVTSVWSDVTDTFNFNQLSIGDEVFLRVHIRVTTSSANQISGLSLLFAEGTPSEYRLPIDIQIYHRTAGVHDVTKEITFYLGNEDWRTLPVKLQFNSDANATIRVYGWHPYIIRKSINILDVNDDNYKTFEIVNIEANNDDTTVDDGKISIGYNPSTNKINLILLDVPFSSYVYNYDQLSSVYDFSVNWVDKTNGKSFTSFIDSYTQIGARYKLTLQETLDYTDFAVTDKIELYIQAQIHNPSIDDSAGVGVLNKAWSADKLIDTFQYKSEKGQANGYAPLNSSTKIDSVYLPSYVDDIIEVADFGSLPLTGETGKIYITLDDNKQYRWSGSVYVNMIDSTIPSLQEVTDVGATTTNPITANSFIKTGGTASQFLKADGSVDTASYWNLQGNNAISTEFLGTTNNVDLNFRRNNIDAGRIQANNTTLGVSSGQNLDKTYAAFNTAIGIESLFANVLSDNNTAIGAGSLYGATNPNNTAVGAFSLGDQTNGSNNTALGYNAGRNHNGSNNIFIGKDCALGVLGAGTNNILIGVSANFVGGGSLSNQINIGDFLYKSSTGNFGIDISTPTAKLDINGEARIRTRPAGATTDTIITANGSGDIRALPLTTLQSGTSGQVAFFNGTNVQGGSSNLFWDNTNKRLGVGATPASTVRLDVRAQGALSTDIGFRVRNSANTANLFDVQGDGVANVKTRMTCGSQGMTDTGGALFVYAGNSGDFMSRWFNTAGAGVVSIRTVSNGGQLTISSSSGVAGITLDGQNSNALTLGAGRDIYFDTTTGTRIGASTTQKFAFWNKTPIVQPTTAIAAATFVSNTSGILNDSATFDGYTIGQIVKALRNVGILA